jgi:FKBP-type peptidyl-prolyl cis-trans isomerase
MNRLTDRFATAARTRIACFTAGTALLAGANACTDLTAPQEERTSFSVKGAGAKPVEGKNVDKLSIDDLKVGTGKEAKSGDTVSVHYTGNLTNGETFDSSIPRNSPFETKIGVGRVIKGWDQGIPGMKVGGKRKLTIPGSLAYGEAGSPPKIPPNATLVFEVELLDIK